MTDASIKVSSSRKMKMNLRLDGMKELKYIIPNFGPKMPRMLMIQMQMQDSESCGKVGSQESNFITMGNKDVHRGMTQVTDWGKTMKGIGINPTPLVKQCSFTGEEIVYYIMQVIACQDNMKI
jgi:hypothetical protein